ncbi:MAG TPA: MFS transporter [Acidimicrobiales bacterium]|nr:MFS transporter [Acidimicrobiales bacterium]
MSLLPLPVRAAATSTFRSLRVRNFRLFWIGQMVSVSGTWMQSVAQNWLVLSMTGSGVALGVTVALQFLPMLLFGMWGGLVADRFDKRRILVVTQVVPMVLALVMFVLVATGAVALWMVYALALLLGLVFMVDMPTRQSFVVELVGPDEVANAVGLNSAMFNTGRVVGPALAGVLIATVGTASTFLLNALSYVAVMAALAAMRPAELFPQVRAERARGAIRAGLRYVWTTPALRSTLVLVAVVGTFGMNFGVVLPILARYTFDGGAPLYGWLTSLMSLGSLLGALTAAGRVGPTRTMLIGAGAAFGALTLLAAVAPSPVLVGAALVAVGVAIMLFLATANTTLQLACAPAMRGRVMALYGLVFLGSTPLGGPLLGWISGHWGGRWGLAVSGAVSLAAALAAAAPPVARRWRAARAGGSGGAGVGDGAAGGQEGSPPAVLLEPTVAGTAEPGPPAG